MTRQAITDRTVNVVNRQFAVARIAAVVVVAAAAGYWTSQTFERASTDAHPAAGTAVTGAIPDAQTMQELRDAIVGQYGTRPWTSKRTRARAIQQADDVRRAAVSAR